MLHGISNHLKRLPQSNQWSGALISVFTLSGQSYTVSESGASSGFVMSRFGRAQGKFYWELQPSATGTFDCALGIRRSDESVTTGPSSGQTCALRSNNTVWAGSTGATTGAGATYATEDRVMCAIDLVPGGTNNFWMGVNGTWANSGNPAAGTGALFSGFPAGEWHIFAWCDNNAAGAHNISLGNGQSEILPFTYSVPDGFSRGLRY